MPPETFDLVIVGRMPSVHLRQCGVRVLEYFDAHVVGLTATPAKQTFGFFRQNLVCEYTYARVVADGVNVDFDVYRIHTKITSEGATIEAGDVRADQDRRTRQQRIEGAGRRLPYTQPAELDRLSPARPRSARCLETFRDRLFTEIFPGRTVVPKTLIFAKDDNHAEEIVRRYAKSSARATTSPPRSPTTPASRRNFCRLPQLARPRIAVTVDMIATGTDVKAIECVFFMRDVRSPHLLRADEGPRCPHHQPRPISKRSRPTPKQDPVRNRRRSRCYRARLCRCCPTRTSQDGPT